MTRVTIRARHLRDRLPCRLVAEVGSGHDFDFDKALRLIKVKAAVVARISWSEIRSPSRLGTEPRPGCSSVGTSARQGGTTAAILRAHQLLKVPACHLIEKDKWTTVDALQ